MTDELKALKERVGLLDKQLERMQIDFNGALKTGETSKVKATIKRLIFEAQSTKEYTKTLLSKFQQDNNYEKIDLCLKLLEYIGKLEDVILALKEG